MTDFDMAVSVLLALSGLALVAWMGWTMMDLRRKHRDYLNGRLLAEEAIIRAEKFAQTLRRPINRQTLSITCNCVDESEEYHRGWDDKLREWREQGED